MAKTLIYDSITGKYFIGDKERIKESIEELNKKLLDRSRLNLDDIICNELCLDFDYKQFEENPNYKPIDMDHMLQYNGMPTI